MDEPTHSGHAWRTADGRLVRVYDDTAALSEAAAALVAGGAELIAPPTETPWRSRNARLAAPGDLQITLFEELRDSSQLIVITHQKRTMEIADALYGVSMQGNGVTTVVSQRVRDVAPAV